MTLASRGLIKLLGPKIKLRLADVRVFSTQSKSIYRCSSCGKETPKWSGQCSQCKSWNTLEENVTRPIVNKEGSKVEKERQKWIGEESHAIESLATQASSSKNERILFKDPELTRVFGGGLVYGSVVLLAGTPGVGKSTLALQIADMISQQLANGSKALYVSGEESVEQVGMRAKRLSVGGSSSFKRVDIVNQPNLNKIIDSLDRQSPYRALIVDSIQTVYLDDVESDAGGVVQIRACALACVHLAKSSNIPVILIGHVTKSGDVAGPKMLEHLVDVVLYFDAAENSGSEIRWLHCHKNRFGANDIGVFQLTDAGLIPMSETSLSFVSHLENVPQGVAWCVTNQGSSGSRFVVAEVQALTNPVFSNGETGGRPKKTKASGVPLERIEWLSAVLSKHVPGGKILNQSDVFINVIGGLQTTDRGNDLAFGLAMASSALGREVLWPTSGKRSGVAFVGEVGLTGDLRPSHGMWSRINAASKAGLAQLVVPKRWWSEHSKDRATETKDIHIVPIESIREAVVMYLSAASEKQPIKAKPTVSKLA